MDVFLRNCCMPIIFNKENVLLVSIEIPYLQLYSDINHAFTCLMSFSKVNLVHCIYKCIMSIVHRARKTVTEMFQKKTKYQKRIYIYKVHKSRNGNASYKLMSLLPW